MGSTTTTSFNRPLSSPFHLSRRHNTAPAPSRRLAQRRLPRGAVAYMERDPNSVSGIAARIVGSLPLVGLVARLLSDEGGFGDDVIDFAEFRRKVGKKCGINDSKAFYELQERRGRPGDPIYVLFCCWLAAVGAGLLKSEEIMEGVARLRLSNDIEYEEENFMSMMIAVKEKRAKSKGKNPVIPMELRAEKALEAIYVCSFGQDNVEDEDAKLLCTILKAVFPSVGEATIDNIVRDKVKQVAEGERTIVREPKPISKEALLSQMKDLEFVSQNLQS